EWLVLSSQLRLLRPVDLWPLPRRRDPCERGGAAASARRSSLGRRRSADDRDHLGGAPPVVLAVELRRAARRDGAGCRVRLALAQPRVDRCRGGRARVRRARVAGRAPQAGREVVLVALACDGRALDARLEGRQGRRASPGRGRRCRRLPSRLRAALASPRQGSEGCRVAHDADHRRGRDGVSRAAAARVAGGRGACRRVPAPRPRLRRNRAARLRTSLGRDPRALPLLQRALRGPDVLGTARARCRRGTRRFRRRGTRVIRFVERALVLAPHTDDGEFGCGGTMARLVEAGTDVRYVAFSIATRSLPDGFAPDTLAGEVRDATAEIGIPVENLTVHDFDVRTFPEHRQDTLEALVALWEEGSPDVVFQPSLHDVHQDHKTIAEEGLRAF